MAKETIFTPPGWTGENMTGYIIVHPEFGPGLVTDQVTRRAAGHAGLTARETVWSILWNSGRHDMGVPERIIMESEIHRPGTRDRLYATWDEATSKS
jgi:hypothetical protein